MNRFNIVKKSVSHKLKISRSGPHPHNDPPTFKNIKRTRFIAFGEHNLWFENPHSTEYFINLKHMYLTGCVSTFMQILKVFFGGLIIPTAIVFWFKSQSQGTRDYYRKEYSPYQGDHVSPYNHKSINDKVRENFSNSKDFLGRKDHKFYKSYTLADVKPEVKNSLDKYIERKDDIIG